MNLRSTAGMAHLWSQTKKVCLTFALLFSLFFATTAARAGSWSSPVYTGTTTQTEGTTSTTTALISPSNARPIIHPQSIGLSADITATFTWTHADPNNPGADPPPQTPVYVLETADVYWVGGVTPTGSASGTANDGIKDAQIIQPGGTSGRSAGGHLSQHDGSSGTVTLHCSPMVTVTVSPNYPGGGGASWSYSAALDSRYAWIQTPWGQTYHRNSDKTQGANNRSKDGSISDDTVAPDPASTGTPATFQAHRSTTWGLDSNYEWKTTLSGLGDLGVFNSSAPLGNKTIPDLSGTYVNPPASAGKSDTVTLTLTDGSGRATASNTAKVKFHDPYEDWARVTTISHPVGSPGGSNPDWATLEIILNKSAKPLPQTVGTKQTLSKTITGTIALEQSLTPKGIAAFKANESLEIGKTVTSEVSATQTYTGDPWTRTVIYWAQTWEERQGTCSVWGQQGYVGASGWNAVYVSPLNSIAQVVTDHYPHP